VHLVLCLLFLVWAVLLIEWHYRQFVTVRQHYLQVRPQRGNGFAW
jgi:hypothetical protein